LKIQFIQSATAKEGYPKQQLPKVVFSGRSNVGKSSLINSLVGRKGLARVSNTPGRTRVINFFNVEDRWMFVDLPGYGYAKVSQETRRQWKPMIEEFLSEGENLRLAIMVVDCRREPSDLDNMMQSQFEHLDIPYQIVATKSDKLSRAQLNRSLEGLEKVFKSNVIPYSAATGMGKKELWHILERI